jgi:hypothetical protein
VRLITEDVPVVFTIHGVDRYVGRKEVGGWFVGLKPTSGFSEFWLQSP